ncbi:MAG: protein translocase subunit SecD [Dehalococcoidia bacterium]
MSIFRLLRYLPQGNNLRLLVIGIIAIAAMFLVGIDKISVFGVEREGFRQGLDIKGGTHLVYEAKPVEGESITSRQLDGVVTIIRRRIDAFGVTEPIIQKVGDDRIMVQIPGIRDVERAKRLIGATAQLDFRQQREKEDGTLVLDENGSVIWDPATATGSSGTQVHLTGRFMRPTAQVILDPTTNLPQVAFEFNREGARLFEQITERLLQKPLGIFLDGLLISAPTVQAVIADSGVITGLTLDEADDLAIELNAGALPIPIELIREQDVDATLGAESVNKSLVAAVIGVITVLAFMMAYYRLPGILAAAALIIYGLIVLTTFKLIPVTLTLSGIAGFILSIGMAVDANILIFERLKEELRAGRSLKAAVEAGFNRAWTAIRDSNVSTLITCGILFWFGDKLGTPLVTGFAVALAIGVVTSMFTAMFVTRSFLRFFIGPSLEERLHFFNVKRQSGESEASESAPVEEGEREGWFLGRRLNIVDKRLWYLLISAVVIVPGLMSMVFPPVFKPGIEFSSGTTIEVSFINPADVQRLRAADVTVSALREELSKVGHGDAIIQRLERNAFLIRTRALRPGELDDQGNVGPSESEQIKTAFLGRFGPTSIDKFEVSFVSPIVASESVRNAAIAVLVAIVGIFVYIAWAFRKMPHFFRYSAAAVIALAHDVVIILGLFSIMGKAFDVEINTMFITGLLAVIGYSINDSIVVLDRVRENVLKRTGDAFEVVANNSLLETIGRSVNTSLTTAFVQISLLLLGGATLRPFILVLFIGTIVGTYSSIFIATQLLVMWEKREFGELWRRVQMRFAGAKE